MEVTKTNALKVASVILSFTAVLSGMNFTSYQMVTERKPSHVPVSQASIATADRTDELNTLFADANPGDTIRLGEETYRVEGHVILPRSKDVSIDATGTEFHGRAIFLAVNSSGLDWRGGIFLGDGSPETRMTFNLFKTRDSTFQDMVFERAISFGNHAFDLLGSEDVLIDGLTVKGYGDTASTEELAPHSLYAEAVQVDYALRSGVGNAETENLIARHDGDFDGRPSKSITVQNSLFTPSFTPAGEIYSWAPPPFGNHLSDQSRPPVESLTFTENVVIDPIPTDNLPSKRWSGALHFSQVSDLTISKNYLELSDENSLRIWIEVEIDRDRAEKHGRESANFVSLSGNRFAGSPPSKSYLLLPSQDHSESSSEFKVIASDNSITPLGLSRMLFHT